MYKYYIDESGNSGDLVSSTGIAFDYAGQPYFVLAAIGSSDCLLLEDLVNCLKEKHKLPSTEIKTTSGQTTPAFVADLLSMLLDRKYPLFVEIIDKRYVVCINIVNVILLPPAYGSDQLSWVMRNRLVDWLYDHIPDTVLDHFIQACRAPSDYTLMLALDNQMTFAVKMSRSNDPEGIALAMQKMVRHTIHTYMDDRKSEPMAFLKFLPIPDDNKKGQKIWMLPNLSCFTNLLARLNDFHKGELADVTLIHDQQLQFDHVLERNKSLAENLGAIIDDVYVPNGDYHFAEIAQLKFAASDVNVGIQCADVLAGTVMRYFRAKRAGATTHPTVEAVVRRLLTCNDPVSICNQVVPSRMVRN